MALSAPKVVTLASMLGRQSDQLLLSNAIEAVRKAAIVCEHVRRNDLVQSTSKDDKSPVTVADFAAQAVVTQQMASIFPEIPLVGEEDAGLLRGNDVPTNSLRDQVRSAVQIVNATASEEEILQAIDRGAHKGGSAGRFWVCFHNICFYVYSNYCQTLDPIDGTKGFLRNDQYAIALALIEDGNVILGVLGCPNLPSTLDKAGDDDRGCGFLAFKGHGAYQFSLAASPEEQEFLPIRVSSTKDAEATRFVESVESGHTAHDLSARIAEKLQITRSSVRMDSQAKYGVLSRGDAELYLRLPRQGKRYEEKIWDHAAGVILVEEAGGKVTDIYGKPLDFSLGRTLVSNTGITVPY
eukprot:gene6992-9588_t